MACPNCAAPEQRWHNDGGVHLGTCFSESSPKCCGEICSRCAALYEQDADGDSEGYRDRSRFVCFPCRILDKGAEIVTIKPLRWKNRTDAAHALTILGKIMIYRDGLRYVVFIEYKGIAVKEM